MRIGESLIRDAHNRLMARALPEDAGPGEDWVSIDYFPIWNCGNFVRSADNGVRTENGNNGKVWNLDPWLQLERVGNVFHFRTSQDGVTWTEMGVSPLTRNDFANVPLQVGLFQCTYSSTPPTSSTRWRCGIPIRWSSWISAMGPRS